MTRGALRIAGLAGVAALAAAVPCALSAKPVQHRAPRFAVDTDRLHATPFAPLLGEARFSFTAPGGASTARADTVERAFRFTPSGQPGRKALSIGVSSARVVEPARTVVSEGLAPAPAAYNVGLAVGWHGFAVNGGYSRVETPMAALGPNRREGVDLGLSYRSKNWKGGVQVAAETGSPFVFAPLERRYSVDVGGAYALGPRVQVSGGVRYRLAPVQPSLLDTDRPDGSVYLGTAFTF